MSINIRFLLLFVLIFPVMAKSQVKVQQTAGRDALGEFAPEFAHLNDDILLVRFGVAIICCRFATAPL